jgi:pimeloyl-ACP methyl ester carboxylesterase
MPKVNAHPASQRGVDGNAPTWALRLMRLGFGALRRVSRPAAVAALTRLFVTPRRHPAPARERALLADGRREAVALGKRQLALWRFAPLGATRATGEAAAQPPCALLVHGWEGRGGQLAAFALPLRQRGYEVALFDHVGHGASEGRRCSLIAMHAGIVAVAEHLGADRVRAIVAHSMGSAAVTLALDGGALAAPRLVYVAPPYDLVRYFGHYLELVVGDQDLLPDMLRRMERRFGASVEDVHYDNLLPRRWEPLLVLHSHDDLDVTEEAARAVAEGWPGARLEAYDGLGHRRILRDALVIERAVTFIASAPDLATKPPACR